MQGLADQASDYLRQHRALAQAAEAASRQVFAGEFVDQLRSLDNPVAIERVALATLARAFEADRIGLGLVDAAGRDVEFGFVDVEGVELLTGDFPVGAFGLDRSARTFPRAVQFPAPNAVTIPIVRERKLRALLHMYRNAARGPWAVADVEFASDLVDRLWIERARARADAALHESEARLRTVLEGVTDAFYVLDRQWRFTVFNRAAETFFQLRREEVLGRKLLDVIPSAKGSAFEQSFARVMARSRSETFSGASTFWPDRHVQCRVYPQAGGGVAASFTDVTEQRRLDLALQDREAHLSALYAQSGVGLAETDMDGRFIGANAEYCRIVGRTLDQLRRLRMAEVTHPDDLRASTGLINRLALGVGVFSIQKRYVRPDESICHVANTVSLIQHASKLATTLVVAIDISDRRAVETALYSPGAGISRVPHAAGNGPVARADPEGRFTSVTPSFCRLLGRSEGEIMGSPILEIIHPDDIEASAGLYSRMRDAGEPFQIDHRLLRPDGGTVWLTSSGSIQPGALDGEVLIALDHRRSSGTRERVPA